MNVQEYELSTMDNMTAFWCRTGCSMNDRYPLHIKIKFLSSVKC